MKKQETLNINYFPNNQQRLFLYEKYFSLFARLFKKNLLPRTILLTGQYGIGKSTFSYHFINFILSENEDNFYNYNNFTINPLNKSFRLISQNCHPNFYLIKASVDKQTIDVKQIKDMINYANKTSFDKKIKFILIDNAEYLNLYSVNALLKIVEEHSSNTFFIFIHNSYLKLSETLRSRCIEFKISFSSENKQEILNDLLTYYNLKIDRKKLDEIKCYYDTPGMILSFVHLANEEIIDLDNIDLRNVIINLMELNLKNKNNDNLRLLQNSVELFFFKKINENLNKNKILFTYSKIVKQLNLIRKFNIDMNNTFYEIKENIIHG